MSSIFDVRLSFLKFFNLISLFLFLSDEWLSRIFSFKSRFTHESFPANFSLWIDPNMPSGDISIEQNRLTRSEGRFLVVRIVGSLCQFDLNWVQQFSVTELCSKLNISFHPFGLQKMFTRTEFMRRNVRWEHRAMMFSQHYDSSALAKQFDYLKLIALF